MTNLPSLPDLPDAEDFTKWATSPSAWFKQAEQLRRSGELLWEPISHYFDTARPSTSGTNTEGAPILHASAFLLVAGFAIEAMLKAAAIQMELNAGGVDRVIVGGPTPMLRGWVKTHKLENLTKRAGIAYTDDLLLYLRRFERYIMWAGRYPVPVAPPASGEPRGFDYLAGVQDRDRFADIYGLARDAFLAAQRAEGAWREPTAVGSYREREAAWAAAVTDWLRIVRPALIDGAIRRGQGQPGVLLLNIDADYIRAHLTTPEGLLFLHPAWHPADNFISLVAHRCGVGAETAKRWAQGLAAMDPSHDAALFLYSTPDADGRWFSRYIFLKFDGSEGTVEGEAR